MAIAATSGRIVVLDEAFCAPQPVTLIMNHNNGLFTKTHFEIFDANQKPMFQVRGRGHGIHTNRILYDTSNSPILTMRDKVMSIHKRWMVYRGDSTEKSNVLFTVKDSKYWQLRPNLDVFLASNPNENECDFHLEGRNSNQTCTIYKGDTVIAEVRNNAVFGELLLSKDSLLISIKADVDYVFILSLITVYYEIKILQNAAIAGAIIGGAVSS